MILSPHPNPPNDHDYPFQGLQSKLHGIRYGELVTITAGSGIGKSSFCRELATSLLQTGERVGYLALEESNRRSSLGLMSAAVGKSLHLGEPSREELVEAFDATMANWDLYLFDGFGSYDPDVIYNRIEYLATGLDCRIVFLDHLSILLSGLEGDERRMIDHHHDPSYVPLWSGLALHCSLYHIYDAQEATKTMKKEHESPLDNCADLLQSLNSATRSLDWREINNPRSWRCYDC